jgi:tetratricopeptide (TPR) repeat protein
MRKWWIIAAALLMMTLALPAAAQNTGQDTTQPVSSAQGLYQSAQQALQNQDYERAILDISLYILLNPTSSEAHFLRSVSYLRSGELDTALADINAAIRFAPEDLFPADYRAALVTTRGEVNLAREDFDAAEADYTQAIAIDSTSERFLARADFYARRDDLDAALADIDSAIDRADAAGLPQLYLIRASFNTFRGQSDEAVGDYYRFIVSMAQDTQVLDPLNNNEPVSLPMAPGRVYRIPFTAERGQVVSAIATPGEGSQADPLLVILAPDDTPLAASDDVDQNDLTAFVENVTLETAGTYTLVISHSGGGDSGAVVVAILVQ